MPFYSSNVSNRGGRQVNEDTVGDLEFNGRGCWVLADGLGGHGGGALASRIAVDTVLASFRANPEPHPDAVTAHIRAANHAVLQQQPVTGHTQMRTTIVVLVADERTACWGHVGDSRGYLVEAGRVILQTRDHSVPGALAAAGKIGFDEIRFHEDRSRLLRSLGSDEDLEVPTQTRTLCQGDTFLLCSDGFWEYVPEVALELDFAKSAGPAQWLDYLASRVLRTAQGDHDNYSAIAVTFQSTTAPMPLPAVAGVAAKPMDGRISGETKALAAIVALLIMSLAAGLFVTLRAGSVVGVYRRVRTHFTRAGNQTPKPGAASPTVADPKLMQKGKAEPADDDQGDDKGLTTPAPGHATPTGDGQAIPGGQATPNGAPAAPTAGQPSPSVDSKHPDATLPAVPAAGEGETAPAPPTGQKDSGGTAPHKSADTKKKRGQGK